jgi:ABC-type Na+ efflux pump permease subunit
MGAVMNNVLEYLRVIGVLARKDIVQGLKNRNILILFFSVAFIIILYQALPSLSAGKYPTPLYVYDAGGSVLTARLEESSDFEVKTDFPSEEAMKRRLAVGDTPEFGLVIPAGFDQQLDSGTEPVLEGYVAYWMDANEVEKLRTEAEADLSGLAGRSVSIRTKGNIVYGRTDDEGAGTQASMALIFSLAMIGVTLVPHLMFDEKQARTLEVLLISPASETQIAAAKVLTGLFYSAAVAVLAAAVNHSLIVHWGLFLAILLAFALFCVTLGLILGTVLESRAQFAVWAWLVLLPLIMPVIVYLLRELIPDAIVQLAPVIPSVTTLLLLRYVFADPIALGVPLLGLVWILACTGVELAIAARLLRRRDRGEVFRFSGKALDSSAPAGEAARVLPAPRPIPRGKPAAPAAPDTGWRANLRIVAAIALKDVREAYRNRLVFSVIIGTVFLALNGGLLPALINRGSPPTAVVFDEGKSAVVRETAERLDGGGRLVAAASLEDMKTQVVQATGTWIGFVIPADFDDRRQSGAEIHLEAVAAHWADPEKVARTADYFAEQLSLSASAVVKITVAEEGLYPSVDSAGQPLINLLTQFLMLVVVGFAIVPLLFVEEKESRTMDILTVSPAGYVQILFGKLLAGMTYGLFIGIVIALVNLKQIVHWDILALTLFIGALFVVSVGMLIGVLADSPTAAAFWASPLLLLSALPVLFEAFFAGVWPAWLTDLLSWFPTSVILGMFRLSIAGSVPAWMVWQSLAVLGASSAAMYLLVVWVMRRKYSM